MEHGSFVSEQGAWETVPGTHSLDSIAAELRLSSAALVTESEVLLLPEQRYFTEAADANAFPPHTKGLLGAFRDAGVDANLYDDGREAQGLVLRSVDIIVPTLVFLSEPAAQVGLSVVANWISARLLGTRSAGSSPTLRVEYVRQHADGTVDWRRIEGPAETVAELADKEGRRLARRPRAR